MSITLYAYFRSSASWRVRIALHHKGLPFKLIPVDLPAGAQHLPEYRSLSPLGQVPMLEHRDGESTVRITQSIAICEYLEERFPEAPLLPDSAAGRAEVRALAEVVNAGIQPLQNLYVRGRVKQLGGDDTAWSHHFIERGLSAMDQLAAATAGDFLWHDTPTLADVFALPQLANARGLNVELSSFTHLLRAEQSCARLERWAAAAPDRQPGAV